MTSSKLKPLIVSAGFGLHPAAIKTHSPRAAVVLILEGQLSPASCPDYPQPQCQVSAKDGSGGWEWS